MSEEYWPKLGKVIDEGGVGDINIGVLVISKDNSTSRYWVSVFEDRIAYVKFGVRLNLKESISSWCVVYECATIEYQLLRSLGIYLVWST